MLVGVTVAVAVAVTQSSHDSPVLHGYFPQVVVVALLVLVVVALLVVLVLVGVTVAVAVAVGQQASSPPSSSQEARSCFLYHRH